MRNTVRLKSKETGKNPMKQTLARGKLFWGVSIHIGLKHFYLILKFMETSVVGEKYSGHFQGLFLIKHNSN